MEEEIQNTSMVHSGFRTFKYKLLLSGTGVAFVLLLAVLGYFFVLRDSQLLKIQISLPKKELTEEVIHSTADSFTTLQKLEEIQEIQNQFKQGEFTLTEQALDEVLGKYDFSQKDILSETTLLFKIAARLEIDREGGLKDYYDFYNNNQHSNKNRAYALLMATQNVLANNDSQKLLVYLNENEIRNLKNINDPEEIFYQIHKKIFLLYPFPIVTARIAVYELKNVKDKKTAEEIFHKYSFKLEESLELMIKNKGFNHFAANSYGAVGVLYSRLEDFGLVSSASTTAMFETAYKYAKIYSSGSTPHFMLFYYIDYQAKKSDINNVKKLLNTFAYQGNANAGAEFLHKFVKTRFVDEQTFQYYYPYLFKLYSTNQDLKLIIDQIVK